MLLSGRVVMAVRGPTRRGVVQDPPGGEVGEPHLRLHGLLALVLLLATLVPYPFLGLLRRAWLPVVLPLLFSD